METEQKGLDNVASLKKAVDEAKTLTDGKLPAGVVPIDNAYTHEIVVPKCYQGHETLYKKAYTMVRQNKHLSLLSSASRQNWIDGFMNGVLFEQHRAPHLIETLDKAFKEVEDARTKLAEEIALFELELKKGK